MIVFVFVGAGLAEAGAVGLQELVKSDRKQLKFETYSLVNIINLSESIASIVNNDGYLTLINIKQTLIISK